jgi:signal transduction histidine kinase
MMILGAILALSYCALIGFLLRQRAELVQSAAEKARLKQELALRDTQQAEKLTRLEHDLRSSLTGIVGFSSLLKETLQDSDRDTSVLKSAAAIHLSATRTLAIIDAAVAEAEAPHIAELMAERNG